MNGNHSSTEFVKKLKAKVEEIKQSEKKREEYMLLSTVEMDARRDGKLEGKLEDAKNFKLLGVDITKIAQATGLSTKEIEAL